ncbi:MAG: hypothetical protein ACPIOQ_74270 [Promethearchaeia archaeon]
MQDEAGLEAGALDREGDSLDVAASEVSAKMHRKREKLSRCSSSLAISRNASCQVPCSIWIHNAVMHAVRRLRDSQAAKRAPFTGACSSTAGTLW